MPYPKQIIHLDMEAFYAAVEILDNPELKGKPVIVGGLGNRGVVCTASYEARAFGVHSAMPTAWAKRKCPHGIFIPGRMKRYQEFSRIIFAIYRRFTPLVEPLSLDEAFLDVTGSFKLFGPAEDIAAHIKQLVLEETGLTVSAGLATNKFLAKIASDINKPDGLTIIDPGTELEFLHPLPLSRLWGVGKVTRGQLEQLGLKTIGDLSRLDKDFLRKKFGKSGENMWHLARGDDQRQVEPQRVAKSLGTEETYATDIKDLETLKKEILRLSFKVGRLLRLQGLNGRTITLKLKSASFKQITRSLTLNQPTSDYRLIYSTASDLLIKEASKLPPLRLVGITVSQFEAPKNLFQQSDLFAANNQGIDNPRQKNLIKALDAINDKFGEKGILPATILK